MPAFCFLPTSRALRAGPARRSTCSAWQTRTALIDRVLVVDDDEPWRRWELFNTTHPVRRRL